MGSLGVGGREVECCQGAEDRFFSPSTSRTLWGAVVPEALVTASPAPARDWLPCCPRSCKDAEMAGPAQAASARSAEWN